MHREFTKRGKDKMQKKNRMKREKAVIIDRGLEGNEMMLKEERGMPQGPLHRKHVRGEGIRREEKTSSWSSSSLSLLQTTAKRGGVERALLRERDWKRLFMLR